MAYCRRIDYRGYVLLRRIIHRAVRRQHAERRAPLLQTGLGRWEFEVMGSAGEVETSAGAGRAGSENGRAVLARYAGARSGAAGEELAKLQGDHGETAFRVCMMPMVSRSIHNGGRLP